MICKKIPSLGPRHAWVLKKKTLGSPEFLRHLENTLEALKTFWHIKKHTNGSRDSLALKKNTLLDYEGSQKIIWHFKKEVSETPEIFCHLKKVTRDSRDTLAFKKNTLRIPESLWN